MFTALLGTVTGFFGKYLLPILGGLLALSLVGNISLGLMTRHYALASHDCKQAVVQTVKAAEQKKAVIIIRDQKIVQKANTDIPTAITTAADSVRRYSREQHLRTPTTPSDGPPVGSPSTKLYATPDGYITITESDGLLCAINTVKAQSWQRFYQQLQEVRAEENATDTSKRSLSSISGGIRTRNLSGLGRSLDVGPRRDGLVWAWSPTVQGSSFDSRGSSSSIGMALEGEVSTGSLRGIS